jgi:nucleotide-binding universal stress UspA family protein
MKTLLITTDLSENARHAATYGYFLAQQLKTRILLCHVMNVPAEIPQTGIVAWPADIYEDIIQDSDRQLGKLKRRLVAEGAVGGYQPEIVCIHDAGFVVDVVNAEADLYHADMILTGMHGNDGLTTLMIGNHTRKMIESAIVPLLVVPFGIVAKPIRRIAFGSDFKQPEKDIEVLNKLVAFAKEMDSELVLAHIDVHMDILEDDAMASKLLTGMMAKLGYKKISYQVVKTDNVEDGLEWLINNANIDMIAMTHRDHNFFEQLLNGSHTQKAARQMPVPVMVLKAGL